MPRTTRPGRPTFNKSLTYVAVRPIRVSTNSRLEPGDKIEGRLPKFAWRRRAKLRQIGPEGHPWTEYMLAQLSAPVDATEEAVKKPAKKTRKPKKPKKVEEPVETTETKEGEQTEDESFTNLFD